jgi:hypothetical protein
VYAYGMDPFISGKDQLMNEQKEQSVPLKKGSSDLAGGGGGRGNSVHR